MTPCSQKGEFYDPILKVCAPNCTVLSGSYLNNNETKECIATACPSGAKLYPEIAYCANQCIVGYFELRPNECWTHCKLRGLHQDLFALTCREKCPKELF
jgi:hypothetical protein